jgi:hypothetical protein
MFYRLAAASLIRRGVASVVAVNDWEWPEIASGGLAVSRSRAAALHVAEIFERAHAGLALSVFHQSLGFALGYEASAIDAFIRKSYRSRTRHTASPTQQ